MGLEGWHQLILSDRNFLQSWDSGRETTGDQIICEPILDVSQFSFDGAVFRNHLPPRTVDVFPTFSESPSPITQERVLFDVTNGLQL